MSTNKLGIGASLRMSRLIAGRDLAAALDSSIAPVVLVASVLLVNTAFMNSFFLEGRVEMAMDRVIKLSVQNFHRLNTVKVLWAWLLQVRILRAVSSFLPIHLPHISMGATPSLVQLRTTTRP